MIDYRLLGVQEVPGSNPGGPTKVCKDYSYTTCRNSAAISARRYMTYWQRWIWRPQTVWLRKATFQLHLWSGIGVGLYVLLASVTGSVLVFSNELFKAATRDPIIVTESGARLTDEQLQGAATRLYPGSTVLTIRREQNPDQAVTISLKGRTGPKDRLFNPFTGADLGDPVPFGIWLVSKTIELHDDLLGGTTGRKVNGAGALLLIVLAGTGIVVWWPGIKTWRRSLTIQRNVGWQRFIWGLAQYRWASGRWDSSWYLG